MKTLLTVIVLLMCTAMASAQQAHKVYRTKIHTTQGRVYTGSIISLSDSVVEMIPLADAKAGKISGSGQIIRVPTSEIKEIRLRNINKLRSSIVTGAIVGAVLGGVLGSALGVNDCDDTVNWGTGLSECDQTFDKSEAAVLGALVGIELGAGVGVLIGTHNETFLIDGNLQKYNAMQQELEKFVLKP